MTTASIIANGWDIGVLPRLIRTHRRRRRRRSPRLSVRMAALALAVLPFVLAGTGGAVQHWISNRALAAVDSGMTGGRLMHPMSASEQNRHRRDLRDLLGGDADVLMKLVESDVEAVFSAPGLRRAEGPVRVWQYRTGDCVLDVYFSDVSGDEKQAPVSWYEVRSRGGAGGNENPDAASCVRSVSRAAGSAGEVLAAR